MSRLNPYAPDPPLYAEIGRRAREIPAGDVAASRPDGLFPGGAASVKLPGFNFPPDGAIPVDPIGDASIAPGAAAVLVTIEVPPNLRLRLAGIGFHADDEVALGYLTWSIRLGPDAAQGYPEQLAAVGSLRQLSPIVVLASSSQPVTVRANIAATAPITYRYACRLQGYFYLEREGG